MIKKNRILQAFSGGELWIIIFSIIFGGWLMFGTFSYVNNQFIISSKVWSDFAAHIPLIRSFSLGSNFPPEYPLFPNEPIRYHFFFYLAVGVLEKIGLNIAWSLNLLSLLGFAVLLLMIFKITKLFFNSKKAGFLAVYLFLFNGSLSFIKYFEDNGISFQSVKNIFSQNNYVSFGPWDGGVISAFWNLNIYTNQRHLALGVGLFMIGIYPLLVSFIKKKYLLSNKTIALLFFIFLFLPLIHQAGYVALIVFVSGWLSFYYISRHFKFLSATVALDRKVALMYLILILISLCIPLFFLTYGENKLLLEIGFLSTDKSFIGLLDFWLQNIGFYLFLILMIPFWIVGKKKNKNSLQILVFYFGFLSFFIVSNLYRLSTDMINNHKFVNIFMIGMNILTAGLLIDLTRKNIINKIIVVFIVLIISLSGIIDFFPLANDHKYTLDDIERIDIGNWIARNTPENSVFLTTTYIYHPASLAGRKIFIDYGYFAWSLGYNDGERRKLLPLLFTSNNITKKSWCDLIINNKIDYVIISPGKGDLGKEIQIENSFIVMSLPFEYITKDNYKIYQVKTICHEKK